MQEFAWGSGLGRLWGLGTALTGAVLPAIRKEVGPVAWAPCLFCCLLVRCRPGPRSPHQVEAGLGLRFTCRDGAAAPLACLGRLAWSPRGVALQAEQGVARTARMSQGPSSLSSAGIGGVPRAGGQRRGTCHQGQLCP